LEYWPGISHVLWPQNTGQQRRRRQANGFGIDRPTDRQSDRQSTAGRLHKNVSSGFGHRVEVDHGAGWTSRNWETGELGNQNSEHRTLSQLDTCPANVGD